MKRHETGVFFRAVSRDFVDRAFVLNERIGTHLETERFPANVIVDLFHLQGLSSECSSSAQL